MTYTITSTRRQWLVKTSDGQRWLFQRSDTGAARRDRRIATLQAAGYAEQAEPEHWLTACAERVRRPADGLVSTRRRVLRDGEGTMTLQTWRTLIAQAERLDTFLQRDRFVYRVGDAARLDRMLVRTARRIARRRAGFLARLEARNA